jgi:hypothetical protein
MTNWTDERRVTHGILLAIAIGIVAWVGIIAAVVLLVR